MKESGGELRKREDDLIPIVGRSLSALTMSLCVAYDDMLQVKANGKRKLQPCTSSYSETVMSHPCAKNSQ